jgi:hypothetical protein
MLPAFYYISTYFSALEIGFGFYLNWKSHRRVGPAWQSLCRRTSRPNWLFGGSAAWCCFAGYKIPIPMLCCLNAVPLVSVIIAAALSFVGAHTSPHVTFLSHTSPTVAPSSPSLDCRLPPLTVKFQR